MLNAKWELESFCLKTSIGLHLIFQNVSFDQKVSFCFNKDCFLKGN